MEIEVGPIGFNFLADVFDHHDADIEADALPLFEPDADIPFFAIHFELGTLIDFAEEAEAEIDIVEDEGADFSDFAVGLVKAELTADFFKEFGAGLFGFVAGTGFKGDDVAGAAIVNFRAIAAKQEGTGDFAQK